MLVILERVFAPIKSETNIDAFLCEKKSHIKGLVHKKRTYISLDHWYDFFSLEGKGVF